MEKKYELVKEDSIKVGNATLYRIKALRSFGIKALRSFGNVKAGTLGGYIEKEANLSHEDNCWVSGNAKVFGDAKVFGNAWVFGDARVFGNAKVSGDARVFGNAEVFVEGKDLDKFIAIMKDIIKYAPENCSYLKNTYNKLK